MKIEIERLVAYALRCVRDDCYAGQGAVIPSREVKINEVGWDLKMTRSRIGTNV